MPFGTLLDAFASRTGASDAGFRLIESQRHGHRTSLRDLGAAERRIRAGLAERGVRPGDRVVLSMDSGPDFAAGFFAVLAVGAVPVPTYPPAPGERMERATERFAQLRESCQPRLVLSHRRIAGLLGPWNQAGGGCEIVTVEDIACDAPPPPMHRPEPDDIAFLQYTSGSTACPRGVALSHRAVLAEVAATGAGARLRHDDVLVCWLPLYHDFGLVLGILWPFVFGIECVLLSPMTYLFDPMRWLQAIADHRGTVSPAPNFAFAHTLKRRRDDALTGLDLSHWRLAICGGERATHSALDAFVRGFADLGVRGDLIQVGYGLAEMTLAITCDVDQSPPCFLSVDPGALSRGRAEVSRADDAIRVYSCGVPFPGYRVRITGDGGDELPEGLVGRVQASGPSQMRGYYEDPQATAAAVTSDGWIDTGDLGFVIGGELYITGRSKDVIILRGQQYHADDVEERVERHPKVRKGGCFALCRMDAEGGESLALAVESTARMEGEDAVSALKDELAAAVHEDLGVRPALIEVLPPRSLPRTSSGKKQRQRARSRLFSDNG